MQENQICRLCYSRNTETDTVDIYSEKGKDRDYLGKINRYLYLRVTEIDTYPKTICWMCSNQLNTFHKFYEKVSILRIFIRQNKLKNVAFPLDQSNSKIGAQRRL